MTIYRIVLRTSWSNYHSQENDQFLEGTEESDVREKVQFKGSLDTIASITETTFSDVNELKYYLIGLVTDWAKIESESQRYFLVKAINGRDAVKRIDEEIVGRYGTLTKVNDVRYFGKINLEEEIISEEII